MAKTTQTTAAMAFVKLLLTVFNLIFWITGLVLVGLGIWGMIGLQEYLELSDTDFSNVPFILLGTGLFMIAAGIIGCCAIMKNLAWFLHLYGIMILVVFIALLAAGISGFIYRQPLTTGFKDSLRTHINQFKGDGSVDTDIDIDRIQMTLSCCGVFNYSESWLNPETEWYKLYVEDKADVVPSSCYNQSADNQNPDGSLLGYDTAIPVTNKNGTVIVYEKGCYAKVISFLDTKLAVMAFVCVGFAFFQLIGMVLAFCLAKLINENKYEMV